MTLATNSASNSAEPRGSVATGTAVVSGAGTIDAIHLAELVAAVRERLALPSVLSDDTILDSLKTIALHSNVRDRWRAAFTSPLGAMLATGGRDLNTALTTLIALLPRPTS